MESLQTPLSIQGLHKTYGSIKALLDLSFEIGPGEVFGLLGPNGAGKTTLISTVVALEEPDEGSISVYGFDPRKEPEKAKAAIGYVPQELIHHGFFNISEILEFHASMYGLKKDPVRIGYLLKKLELWDHRKKLVNQLSGGMKRRLLIAKALIHRPKLVLLDEPTAGVDIELRSKIWEFIQELKEDGTSILLTTHYLEEAEVLCDRVGILRKGVLMKIDTTKNLLSELSQREVIIVLNKPLPKIDHPQLKLQTDTKVVFQVGQGTSLSDLPIDYAYMHDMHIKEGRLEDVFLNVLEGM